MNGANSVPLGKWGPPAFFRECVNGGPLAVAARGFEKASFLLILLEDGDEELKTSLMAISPFSAGAVAQATSSGLAFKTELRDMQSVLADRTLPNPGRRPHLPVALLYRPCFVVPLQKRVGSTSLFAERITVGRARNHDLVLRHRSVSKFHAWFETDESGATFVADAGSSNHTYANGAEVGSTPVALESGAKLKFGSVEAVFTSWAVLWELISQVQG